MNKPIEIERLIEKKEQISDLQFKIEKADFNDEPTDELERQLNFFQEELIKSLSEFLTSILPRQLPPLQILNPKLGIEQPIPKPIEDLISEVGIEEEEGDGLLLQLVADNQIHYDLIILLGSWYIHQRQADQATGYYKAIIEVKPTDLAYYNLSFCLAVQKILTPALEYLDLISNDFDAGLVLLNKAVIYDKLGRFEEANDAFSKVVDNSDYQSMGLFNWGISAAGFSKNKLAQKLLKKLLQIDPNYPGLHFQLGQVAASLGLYAEAIAALEIAYRDDTSDLEALSDLATACLMAKRFHDAIDYYQKYLEKKQSISVLNNLGAAYLQTNQYKQAVQALDKAVELNPKHKQSLKNLELAKSYID